MSLRNENFFAELLNFSRHFSSWNLTLGTDVYRKGLLLVGELLFRTAMTENITKI